jgi:hypothetical protein
LNTGEGTQAQKKKKNIQTKKSNILKKGVQAKRMTLP